MEEIQEDVTDEKIKTITIETSGCGEQATLAVTFGSPQSPGWATTSASRENIAVIPFEQSVECGSKNTSESPFSSLENELIGSVEIKQESIKSEEMKPTRIDPMITKLAPTIIIEEHYKPKMD